MVKSSKNNRLQQDICKITECGLKQVSSAAYILNDEQNRIVAHMHEISALSNTQETGGRGSQDFNHLPRHRAVLAACFRTSKIQLLFYFNCAIVFSQILTAS